MLRVVECPRRQHARPTLLPPAAELLSADLSAAGTDEAAGVEPVVVQQAHVYLLAGVEAGKGVVEDGQVKTTFLAEVLVAAGPPVLPLPYL